MTGEPTIAAVGEEEPPTRYEFDPAFQTKICAMALRDTAFLQRTEGLIRPEYFENLSHAALVNLTLTYYEEYKKAPHYSLLPKLIQDAFGDKIISRELAVDMTLKLKSVTEADIEAGAEPSLLQSDISDRDYVIDHVATFARHQAVSKAILDSVEHLDKRDFDRIDKLLKRAMGVGATLDAGVYEYGDMLSARTKERLDRAAGLLGPTGISTGYPEIDKHLYHKGWGKRELSVLMGGAKAGKCVRRDTLVFTENGLSQIGDFVPVTLPVGEFAPATMGILGRNGMEPTSHVYNSGLQKTLNVRTRRGFGVEGTYHHPMLVMTEAGEHTWKRLDEIKPGDWMVVQRGAAIYGDAADLTYAVEAAKARIAESKRPDAMTAITMPTTMTPDLAEFLAMVIAEGNLGANGAISFTQKDEVILSRFVQLAKSLFGLTAGVMRQHNRVAFARVANVALQAYLQALGLEWCVSAGKEVPKAVLCAPEPVVRRFVSTVIGLECHVAKVSDNKVTVDLTMASRRLIDQLHMLLLNMGIVACKTDRLGKATNGSGIERPYYRLAIAGCRNIALLAQLGVYESRKQAILDGAPRADKTSRDWIPGARGYVRLFMREMQGAGLSLKSNLDHTHWRMMRTIAAGTQRGTRELTCAFAEKMLGYADRLGFDGVAVQWLRARLAEGYAYDEVVEIEAGETETVDFTVPGTHSFFANGLVSHNTTALINFGINAIGAPQRYNVLYVTLEVAAKIIAERMDANIANQAIFELGAYTHTVRDEVERFMAKAGRFDIVEFPTGVMRVSDLNRLIESRKARGILYDMIVVDYADLMQPEKTTDSTTENSKSIYVNLRGLAMQQDVAILTATQTNRDGAKKAVATMTDVADDFNKIRIADVVISINRTDEERAMNQARLYFAASRNQASGFSIRIQGDTDRMRFITSVLGVE